MGQQQIKHRFTGAVLFECEIPEGLESGLAVRHALETACKARAYLRDADLRGTDLRGAYLNGADLRDADLRGTDLSGADLSGADLRDADLRGTDLSGADLSGADLRDADLSDAYLRGAYLNGAASPEESIANLDKVRAIILDNRDRLNMGLWHEGEGWRDRTCAEETLCETTHCLAGWLQVCSTDPTVRELDPQTAGIVAAPIAAKMFFRGGDEVLSWLEDRKYVSDLAEREKRDAERAAKRQAEGAAS